MTAEIFDGKAAARKIHEQLAKEVAELRGKYGVSPKLAVVLVGNDPASKIYIKMKKKACEEAGILSEVHELPETAQETEVLNLIKKLDEDGSVHGILVQLPLPGHINKEKAMNAINPDKDADGFSPVNMGRLLLGDEALAPCTPKAVMKILDESGVDVEGKNAVIVNRSSIVGKPLSLLLLNTDATVDVCHTKTGNLKEHTLNADILIVAAGVPGMIKADMVKEGVVVIDVGINRAEGRLCGDVDFDGLKEKASLITPVPGGVGPMTVAMLMANTVHCYKKNNK